MVIIYKIYSEKGPKVYIGSSINLDNRKRSHSNDYRYYKEERPNQRWCSSFLLFDEYGIKNCIFEMIEECDEEDRYNRERYRIDSDENCVNKNRPLITKEEKDLYNKEYALNKQKEHPEIFQTYAKKYVTKIKETNPDLYDERRVRNNEKRYEKRKEIITCECGTEIAINSKFRHMTSKKHLELIKKK
jgi:hypothetical protein